jgi:hypothetical protein
LLISADEPTVVADQGVLAVVRVAWVAGGVMSALEEEVEVGAAGGSTCSKHKE